MSVRSDYCEVYIIEHSDAEGDMLDLAIYGLRHFPVFHRLSEEGDEIEVSNPINKLMLQF